MWMQLRFTVWTNQWTLGPLLRSSNDNQTHHVIDNEGSLTLSYPASIESAALASIVDRCSLFACCRFYPCFILNNYYRHSYQFAIVVIVLLLFGSNHLHGSYHLENFLARVLNLKHKVSRIHNTSIQLILSNCWIGL